MNTQEHHTIWPEKYRPSTLEEYVSNPTLIETIKKFIETKQIPHLLFHGTAGTGKTTLAKLIVNSIECDALYINASDENNVDNVRTKVKDFASNVGFSDLKVIILDEADYLTHNSQAALRNIMETYALTTRFILTCNYFEKISEPLYSRCQCFEVHPLRKKDVAIHLKNILHAENVQHTMDDLGYIVNTYYPDIRKILNFAQQSVLDNSLKIEELNSVAYNIKNQIIEILKNETNTSNAFVTIRQLVADSGIRHYEELYQLLYDRVEEYAPKSQAAAILIVAEYQYQSSMVVNKEIAFMACIAKMLEIL